MLPRWMKWLFLVFIGYVVYMGSQVPHITPAATPDAPIPTISAEKFPALTTALDADHWKRAINPDVVAAEQCGFDRAIPRTELGLKVLEEAQGSGAAAVCGDAMTIHLTVWNATGGKGYGGETTLTLGAGALAYGIDAGLVGIRVDGVRTLVLSPLALKRAKQSTADAALRAALPTSKLTVVTIRRVK